MCIVLSEIQTSAPTTAVCQDEVIPTNAFGITQTEQTQTVDTIQSMIRADEKGISPDVVAVL